MKRKKGQSIYAALDTQCGTCESLDGFVGGAKAGRANIGHKSCAFCVIPPCVTCNTSPAEPTLNSGLQEVVEEKCDTQFQGEANGKRRNF